MSELKPFLKKNSGASLVSVLVSIGVAAIIISMSAVAYRNMTFERRLIQSKKSYREVEDALKNIVIENLRRTISSGNCSRPANVSDLVDGSIGAMTAKSVNGIALQTNNSALAKKLLPLREAATRCATPVFPAATGNTFRFCLQLSAGPGARKSSPDSFMGSRDTFAEIQATMMDFTTGQPVTCAQFNAAPRKSGFILTTGLYWVASSDVGPVPNSNVSFMYVPGI